MTQRLYRDKANKKIAGVCAGLADYFDVDVALVRVGFALSVLLHGIGLLAYIIMWIAVPEREAAGFAPPPNDTQPPNAGFPFADSRKRRHGALFAGVALILGGLYFLLDNLFPWFDFDNFSPVFLIIAGVIIIAYGYVNRADAKDVLQSENKSTANTNSNDSQTNPEPTP